MALLHGWKLCPRCGSQLRVATGRADCRACGSAYFAGSAPTANVLCVDDRGCVLLARRAHDPEEGKWDLPGGFLEEGEDPRDAVRRELREEAGVEIEPGRLLVVAADVYGDGPAARATLNLFYEARVTSGEPEPADDVAELRWFAPDELPRRGEFAFSCVALVLGAWRDEHTQRQRLDP